MNKKPIAILSTNLLSTITWMEKYNHVNEVRGQLLRDTVHDIDYVIVQSIDDALGWEFSKYIKAPDYESLESIVQSRVR